MYLAFALVDAFARRGERRDNIMLLTLIHDRSNTLSLKLFLSIQNVYLAFALVDTFARRREKRDNTCRGAFLNPL